MNLNNLNSATKYPSIPCLHPMHDRGRLSDTPLDLPDGDLFVTEKIDGTNARIIVAPDGDWFIGSREELLCAKGDRVWNSSMRIVDTIRKWPEDLAGSIVAGAGGKWTVIYGEVYGAGINKLARSYATAVNGFRAFDWMRFDDSILAKPIVEISLWRDGGGQSFLSHDELVTECVLCNLPMVPPVRGVPVDRSHAGVLRWLNEVCPATAASLDVATPGPSEGVVIRDAGRTFIAKVRREDYQKATR